MPEKVQLFESLSVPDLSNTFEQAPPMAMPVLRFNSNGSIYSADERDEEREEKLFIPSTPAHVAGACDIEELIEQRKRVEHHQPRATGGLLSLPLIFSSPYCRNSRISKCGST